MSLAGRLRSLFGGAPARRPLRWVVLDVEASGLDARRDRLLAIAAVALHFDIDAPEGSAPRIALGDSFEVVLRQPEVAADKANILIHGIGVGAQRQGLEPSQALEGFAHWLGDAPLVAFHSAFDETLIQRHVQAVLGRRLANPWLDLAPVAAAVVPGVKARALDDWLEHFAIPCAVRHQAAADTLATAELLLRLWPAIRLQCRGGDFGELAALAAQGRWLQR
ncbi:MAG TPA: 3'-5' exonuclease [Burkholderiaceae bacterium]|nr:3'-5' exonuclease [Burkholderiaceae bacterium]